MGPTGRAERVRLMAPAGVLKPIATQQLRPVLENRAPGRFLVATVLLLVLPDEALHLVPGRGEGALLDTHTADLPAAAARRLGQTHTAPAVQRDQHLVGGIFEGLPLLVEGPPRPEGIRVRQHPPRVEFANL